MRPILILIATAILLAYTASETKAQCSGGVCRAPVVRVALLPVRAAAAVIPVRQPGDSGDWYLGKNLIKSRQARVTGGGWYLGKYAGRVRLFPRARAAARRVIFRRW